MQYIYNDLIFTHLCLDKNDTWAFTIFCTHYSFLYLINCNLIIKLITNYIFFNTLFSILSELLSTFKFNKVWKQFFHLFKTVSELSVIEPSSSVISFGIFDCLWLPIPIFPIFRQNCLESMSLNLINSSWYQIC